ncbi:MAG: acyl-CoA dehydrogenase family protein [Pseudomonadales bacterium]
MEFGLSEEQTLLADSVNRFLDEASPLDRVRKFVDTPGEDVWPGLVELGIPGILVSEANGGLSMTALDAAIVAEALGSHTAPAPFLGSAVFAPVALQAAGVNPGEVLAALVAGERRLGIAVGEAFAARADAGITSSGSRLTGKALFVLDYGADSYLLADREGALFLVAADAKGLESRGLTTIDRTRRTGELVLNGVAAERISDDPAVLQKALNFARVMLAADTLGAAQNMLDQAVAYANEREQFNRPIGSFQAVKHMCAEMAAHLEPCRALVWYAAHALDELPEEATLYACHTKAHLAEVGKFVAKTATEVHGGMGFTDLVGLHYWFKRIGFNRQLLGTPEQLREDAARAQALVA